MGIRKKIYIDCMAAEPIASAFSSDLSAVDGADTTVTRFSAGGYEMEIYNEAANALLIPKRTLDANSCDGWALPVDNVSDNGIEMGFGILADTVQPHCFTIGTDSAFEIERWRLVN